MAWRFDPSRVFVEGYKWQHNKHEHVTKWNMSSEVRTISIEMVSERNTLPWIGRVGLWKAFENWYEMYMVKKNMLKIAAKKKREYTHRATAKYWYSTMQCLKCYIHLYLFMKHVQSINFITSLSPHLHGGCVPKAEVCGGCARSNNTKQNRTTK